MSKIIDGIAKDLKAIPETLKAKTAGVDKKKLILMNLPYILAGYFCDKIAWLWRVSPGSNASDKMMAAMNGLNDLFSNPLPSFFPKDLLIGIVGGVALRLVVYFKAKNAKKFRQGVEYGYARWGNAKDIEPYVDPVFENNVILTETERLMMSGRPKQPKYARNKNILVIGGSGSGKTRFFVKPNLMQMHSSYVVTDPKDGKIYDSNQAFRCSRYHNKYHSCTGHYIKASTIEMLIYQATKRVSQYVLKDEKEFVEQLKAQYELQCEKDNTDDKKELLEAKRRMMDLDDLIKGLYENFTLGRLPERQFNRLMTEYDTEQSSLEQRISELETATERISTKAVQIDKFVRLVKKYRDFEELTTPMLNDFIEKVVIHEAEGGRTKDRTQQVDIYFNFIGNFVLPLSEDEVEALQSEEARRAEEIAERKRKSSKKSTQKRNQKRAEIKAKAEAGDPEAMAEYKAILEKGRQNNRKRSEKMRELRMSDPEYRAKMEEKERLALERKKKRQERATKKKKIALAELKEQAEKGNQEAVREIEERRAIARERSRKSAEKRKQRAENDPEYAKYLEERNAEYNRRHTARRKEQMEALRARAEAGDQEAQSQLAERKQYQVRATVKSYRKMRDDALSGDPIAKVRYEKTLAMRREAYHAKKSEQTA